VREESEGSGSDPAAFTRELCRELGSLSIASHVTFPVGTGERNLVMRDSPLVSVIILNYKRRDALKLALESVMAQDYQNREIIVVDNNSRDDAEALVHAFDPNIIFIGLSENLGSSAGRNAGIRRARGEILVTIDNDVLLDSPFELTHIVQTFEAHPEVHVLAFQICDATTGQLRLREWCHPRSWKEFGQSEFETHFLPEGASAFRREALDRCGLYYEPFLSVMRGATLPSGSSIAAFGFFMLRGSGCGISNQRKRARREGPITYTPETMSGLPTKTIGGSTLSGSSCPSWQ